MSREFRVNRRPANACIDPLRRFRLQIGQKSRVGQVVWSKFGEAVRGMGPAAALQFTGVPSSSLNQRGISSGSMA